ncbi:class I SAM-dependent methyltransferase [Mycobacterium sp. 852014-50255_SCH5639931]|uniref:class I SAM-dependent methyltransferase n=1 Tax=Mycobacterium sp. 852014-50255_SCH5639931 TaxID=1834112 RepID=UPI0007FE04D3|nr:class I SAM-dependent methyltransferase [Mycobacterium sp. 852014-50255_SCH5639931]OBB69814.1 methyltransferase [Mycobacterium sp. 852014-50255_SCH5639931]
MALTLDQARWVYDRIGRMQDWQGFYEDATTERLVAEAALAGDQTIFEFGCGTGRFAANLLTSLPDSVNYLGVDISPVMVNLATRRLRAWADRAEVVLVDGTLPLPADDGFADRVFSAFVFDLLDVHYAREVLHDLRRILTPEGRLCLASLAHGDRPLERAVSQVWTGLWRMAPQVVGGCRPISLSTLLGDEWQVQHHSRVHRFGLVTDVVIAARNSEQP